MNEDMDESEAYDRGVFCGGIAGAVLGVVMATLTVGAIAGREMERVDITKGSKTLLMSGGVGRALISAGVPDVGQSTNAGIQLCLSNGFITSYIILPAPRKANQ